MKANLAVLVAALAAGCAITPEASHQLDAARAAYQQAAGDPAVRQYAPHELNEAAAALNDAEREAADGESERVAHDAYLAERRARAAQAAAGTRKAAVDMAEAREQRRQAEVAAAHAEVRRADAARLQAEERLHALEQERAAAEQEKTAAAELGAEVKRIEAEHPQVRARETGRGWVLTLGGATLFEQGATLSTDADRTLDDLAGFLRKHPGRGVAVEGFSDGAGPADAAERLSERRAQAVKFALVQRGVEAYRIDARGGGAAAERRVDVVLTPEGR